VKRIPLTWNLTRFVYQQHFLWKSVNLRWAKFSDDPYGDWFFYACVCVCVCVCVRARARARARTCLLCLVVIYNFLSNIFWWKHLIAVRGELAVEEAMLYFFTAHCSLRLIVRSVLDVPTFATRRLHMSPCESTRWQKVELWARNVL
jgi:hypothetical protein